MPNTSVTDDSEVGCCFLVKRKLFNGKINGDFTFLVRPFLVLPLYAALFRLCLVKDDLKCTTDFAG